MRLSLIQTVLVLILCSSTSLAYAETPPDTTELKTGQGSQDPASTGQTELEDQGKFATATVPNATEETDALNLSLSAGGLLSTGNARAGAVTGNANFLIRRNIHQFSSALAANYGLAAPERNADLEPNVANVQGRVRYDAFFHRHISAFLMTTARYDRFQGLDLRLNVDPGFAFYILPKPKHRLWAEVGYDFQYDLRRSDSIIQRDEFDIPVLDENNNTIRIADKYFINHAARLFLGYNNQLSEKVSFLTGLEYLQSFLMGKTFRINWDMALTTQIAGKFSLAATFTLRYENNPLPDIKKLDTITALNLVYTIF